MSDLTTLLEKIRERPALYLGVPSITRLHLFLRGYWHAQREFHCGDNDPLLFEFEDFVEARFKLGTSHGWGDIILFMTLDEQNAFELFWELLDEFVAGRSQDSIPHQPTSPNAESGRDV